MIKLCLLAVSLCMAPTERDFILVEGKVQKKHSQTFELDFSKSAIDKKFCLENKKNIFLNKEFCVDG